MFSSTEPQTIFIGKSRFHCDSLPSTNDYIREMLRERELAEGFTVTTDYQTSGRGQVGNQWISEEAKNLLVSVLLRPKSLSADQYFILNMSVCLAIADTLNFFHPGFLVKWPNDILFDQQKVAGVLIENSIAQNRLKQAIVGIGINVNQRQFGELAGSEVTSLSMVNGGEVDREFLLGKLLQNMEHRYLQIHKSPQHIRNEYFQSLYGFGRTVQVEVEGRKTQASISNVLPDGTLEAEIEGKVQRFQFKEIRFLL